MAAKDIASGTSNEVKAPGSTGREESGPPGRLRLKLNTMTSVKAELARLYREGKAGRRDISDVSKLANVLSIIGRLIEGVELARRVEQLEEGSKE